KEAGRTAHAVADDANRSGALEICNRGGNVEHHVIPVEIAEIAARMGHFVRRISTFEIAHEAIEHGGGGRGIADRRETIAYRANVAVHAENFLNHHNAALGRARWIGAVGAERVFIGGGQGELLTQRNLPLSFVTKNPAGLLAQGLSARHSEPRRSRRNGPPVRQDSYANVFASSS